MEEASLSVLVKRLEGEIRVVLRGQDISRLPAKHRDLLAELSQNLVDARKYTSAYELSETREEQLDNAKRAKNWLTKAKKCILSASEDDIFGAIEVAHLSANLEKIIDRLE